MRIQSCVSVSVIFTYEFDNHYKANIANEGRWRFKYRIMMVNSFAKTVHISCDV